MCNHGGYQHTKLRTASRMYTVDLYCSRSGKCEVIALLGESWGILWDHRDVVVPFNAVSWNFESRITYIYRFVA